MGSLGRRPTPTTRQVSGGGPPPHFNKPGTSSVKEARGGGSVQSDQLGGGSPDRCLQGRGAAVTA
jgi:hypothetical protein